MWIRPKPFLAASPPATLQKSRYDAVKRVLSESLVRPGGVTYATTGYSYAGLQVLITDPRLNTTSRALAAWGPLLQVSDPGSTPARFQYNAFDQLKQATDPAGNVVTTVSYNLRGMRTRVVDMDLGTWDFTSNALGQVTEQSDNKVPRQQTQFTYDLLGRLTTRTEPEGASTWTWGTTNSASEKNIGQLVSVSGPGYSETFAYDTLARPRQRTINADAQYQFDYAYDGAGHVQTLTYPVSTGGVRFKAKYGYSGGYLSSVQDYTGDVNGPVLWTLNLLDARQHATSEAFGNGLWVQNAYDPLTGEPTTRQSGTGGQSSNVQNLSYAWDTAGNLSSRQDLRQGLLESFSYDALNRLQATTGPGGQNTAIGYDAIGNITSKTGIAGNFVYDPVRKHAVTSAGGTSYGYDANGNMTSRGGATISWSSYNLPTVINAPGGYSAQFAYAPDRSRWRQVSSYAGGTETTVYVGGLLEKLSTALRTHWKHLIPTPSGQVQVIRRSDGTSETLYVTTDHLGSTDAVLNAAGVVVMRGSFAAYGERRASNWQGAPPPGEWQDIANTTRQGYTGHEMLDNVMLIHMNGRVFDPAIGRFVSADPYVDGADTTQGWNRYAYVHGGPLSATDPSGFMGSPCAFRACYWNGVDWVSVGAGGPLEEVVITASRWTYPLQSNWEWNTIGSARDLLGQRNELAAHLSDGPAANGTAAGKESGTEAQGEPQSLQSWQARAKEVLCDQAVTDGALTDALTAVDSSGTAADLLRPVAVASATAAGVATQTPNSQAWSFLSGELSTGLRTVARFGNVATGALLALELSRGHVAGALYAGLDFGVFWVLSTTAAAGAPMTGGGSALQAAMVGAVFYANGGSRSAVQSVLCN